MTGSHHNNKGYVLLVVATAMLVVASLVLLLFAELNAIGSSHQQQQDSQALQLTLDASYAHNRRLLLNNTACSGYTTASGNLNGLSYAASLDTTSGPIVNLTNTATSTDGSTLQQTVRVNQYATTNSVALNAAGDAHIEEDKTDHNHSTDGKFHVEATNNSKDVHALLRFDLSAIPKTSLVEAASLTLYLTDNNGETNDPDGIYRIWRSWVESGATWLKHSSGFFSFWADSGGDHNYHAWSQFPNSQLGYQTADITRLAQVLVANGDTHGLLIKSEYNTNSVERKYATREATNNAQRPQLDISYRCLCGTGC